MKRTTLTIFIAAVLGGVVFAYVMLDRTTKEPQPLVEDYEGVVDTMHVAPDWEAEEVIEEPMPAPVDSTFPDSLD